MTALHKLEGSGIQVITSLSEIDRERLQLVAGVTIELPEVVHRSQEEDVKVIIDLWEHGKGSRLPTWKSLLDVLGELKLDGLRNSIEQFFSGKW